MFSHVNDFAPRLEALCNEFCLDLHFNFAHNHGETYAAAYQILQVANFIHDAEYAHDRHAIGSRLNGMGSVFPCDQNAVRGCSHHHHQQTGQLGILSKIEMIESTLHHLMNDVGTQQTPFSGSIGQPPPPGINGQGGLAVAPPPPSLP